MSWSLGWDTTHQRWIGYGVPAVCEHPECDRQIHRGVDYACGEHHGAGCGLYFCAGHLQYVLPDPGSAIGEMDAAQCERCARQLEPFDVKPEVRAWVEHLLADPSWQSWRETDGREQVRELQRLLKAEVG